MRNPVCRCCLAAAMLVGFAAQAESTPLRVTSDDRRVQGYYLIPERIWRALARPDPRQRLSKIHQAEAHYFHILSDDPDLTEPLYYILPKCGGVPRLPEDTVGRTNPRAELSCR